MKVKATNKYEELKLQDNELGRIPKAGEEWEVSKERYEVLTKTNKWEVAFVEKVEEAKEEIKEEVTKKKTETKKKTTKKKAK